MEENNFFKELVEWYLGVNEPKFSISHMAVESVSAYHPNVRAVTAQSYDGASKDFIVKFHDVTHGADKHVGFALRERALAPMIAKFGFKPRPYLLIEESANSPWGKPFSIMERIPGVTAAHIQPGDLRKLMGVILHKLSHMHIGTTADGFGGSMASLRSPQDESFGRFMCEYLMNDIQRDNLPFTKEDCRNLESQVMVLDETRKFALCHGDLTLSNIIVGGQNDQVELIDWTYARYMTPVFDIAYGLFWLIVRGVREEAQAILEELAPNYHKAGFPVFSHLPFCLAHKFIETGRFLGSCYLTAGKKLLATTFLNDLSQVEF